MEMVMRLEMGHRMEMRLEDPLTTLARIWYESKKHSLILNENGVRVEYVRVSATVLRLIDARELYGGSINEMIFVATSAPREYETLIVLQLWIERNHPSHPSAERFPVRVAEHYLAIAATLKIALGLMDEERWSVFLNWRKGIERSFFFTDMAPEIAEAVERMRFARTKRLPGAVASPEQGAPRKIDRQSYANLVSLRKADRPLEEFRDVLSELAHMDADAEIWFPSRLVRAAYILEAEIPYPVLRLGTEKPGHFQARFAKRRHTSGRSLLRALCETVGYP